ncbi:ubiquitin fusion degradation protein 1 homolog [Phtheirospermum japonicum]|uniref:Ubiquitin fusion degradation protein 1 homolog n=1 Tax=Phtheirospermum japonicum TaxID=374723 RepID=A0A830CXI2_9LAMI|nr:ubiquitin fusion degradation protein 1 homolog [Phtheirospermum japonicum]
MPPSSLDRIFKLPVQYPLTFQIETFASDRTSHCGVLEFEAEEGCVHMPDWMMANLSLVEGDRVVLRDAPLPKACFLKLQPHTTSFTEVSDPRAVLEVKLRGFTCLSLGDTFMVEYGSDEFYFDVVGVGPGDAVCLIDTDCELDLATPLDYVEPPPKLVDRKGEERSEGENKVFVPFMGKGRRLDGKPTAEMGRWSVAEMVEGVSRLEVVGDEGKKKIEKDGGKEELFKAFTGRGRVLGGVVGP